MSREDSFSIMQVSNNRLPLRRAMLLALLLLGLRLPWLGHARPIHIDEGGFVEAIGFPALYPVHYPGYPLWIAMGTMTAQMGLDPYAAYQCWSVLSSVAAPLLLYFGLRRRLDDALAWWLGLALGLNPLIWFLATTALNYVAGLTAGLLIIGLCWKSLCQRDPRTLKCAAGVLAVAIFLRPDLLIWLGPMMAYVSWRLRDRCLITCGGIVATGSVLFLVTVALLYSRSDESLPPPTLSHTFNVVLNTSVFRLGLIDGLLRNLAKLCLNLEWDFGLSSILLIIALVRFKQWHHQIPSGALFLLLWVGPLSVFVVLIHMSEPGHVILLLPAGYCLMGFFLAKRCGRRLAIRLAACVALCSFLQFTLYPWPSENPGFKRLLDGTIAYRCAAGLAHIERKREIHKPGDYWQTGAHQTGPAPSTPQP